MASSSSPTSHPPNENQQSHNLPGVTRYITGHNADGKAIVQESRPGKWVTFGEGGSFNVIYTTSEFPADLNGDKDIAAHNRVMDSGKLGLVNPRGTVCRMVDFAPGNPGIMHRTQSLDYGIVLEGELDMRLDSGETVRMYRGDVAVQRATMHAWSNPSQTEWARMIFVLQDCQPLKVGERDMKEDLGEAVHGIPKSGND